MGRTDRPVSRQITVVGLGADGWAGLSASAREVLLHARVLLGSPRQLDLLPDSVSTARIPWPTPLRDSLPTFLAEHDPAEGLVALASGDPFLSGIGTTLLDLGWSVTAIPAVSSVALAGARMGWSAESSAVVTVVGRDVRRVLRECAPDRRVLVLSADRSTPREVATLLCSAGFADTRMTVLGDLGATAESRATTTASTFDLDPPRLHVLALEVSGDGLASWAAGLPDDAFANDGQLTKRDVRASALARLAPTPGGLLWDVGAGAGSVGIEWMRAHPSCRTIAIEANPARADRIARNAGALGVPDLQVLEGRVPDVLADLPTPDAVFVGGGASRRGVLDACLSALRTEGRLVAHAVTLETEAELVRRHAELGGELVRLAVETAAPVGTFTGWTPARAVVQWSFQRGRSAE